MTIWELQELKNSSKKLGNLLNACSNPKHAQTPPLVDNASIKVKMQKMQPRAYQIENSTKDATHVQRRKLCTL
jgi:hypothetical protein